MPKVPARSWSWHSWANVRRRWLLNNLLNDHLCGFQWLKIKTNSNFTLCTWCRDKLNATLIAFIRPFLTSTKTLWENRCIMGHRGPAIRFISWHPNNVIGCHNYFDIICSQQYLLHDKLLRRDKRMSLPVAHNSKFLELARMCVSNISCIYVYLYIFFIIISFQWKSSHNIWQWFQNNEAITLLRWHGMNHNYLWEMVNHFKSQN